MQGLICPKNARQARLYRLVQKLCKDGLIKASMSEGEMMNWVQSQENWDIDKRLSDEEEELRISKIPLRVKGNSIGTYGESMHGSMYFYRDLPMYPGEYVPAEHNSLRTVRDELKIDLAAQNIKDAWLRIRGGVFFKKVEDFYSKTDGLSEESIAEIVSAILPGFNSSDSIELVNKLFETISKPITAPKRQLQRMISAETLGLDNAPQHYTNFMEWMGRITETKAFKIEQAIFEFTRRNFNRGDVREMLENYKLMSNATVEKESADRYSHFYSVLKDLIVKSSAEDTRPITGVRIDPHEFDEETGIALGYGFNYDRHIIALIRENRDRNGIIFFMGKPLNVAFDDRPWIMENILWVFDEANLNFHDFDVYFMVESPLDPFMGDLKTANACRLALANAVTHLIPLTRPTLKKSGLLSVDARQEMGPHPGYIDNKHSRPFKKR